MKSPNIVGVNAVLIMLSLLCRPDTHKILDSPFRMMETYSIPHSKALYFLRLTSRYMVLILQMDGSVVNKC